MGVQASGAAIHGSGRCQRVLHGAEGWSVQIASRREEAVRVLTLTADSSSTARNTPSQRAIAMLDKCDRASFSERAAMVNMKFEPLCS